MAVAQAESYFALSLMRSVANLIATERIKDNA